jgi:biopolymer transport protein ExbD/biopolymer transport protein TolR
MAIAVRNEGAKVNSNINVTPMVDVMLVLLIIFMVITPLLQKTIPVDLAQANNPTPMADADRDDATVVAVTREGKIFLDMDLVTPEALTQKVKDRLTNSKLKTVFVKSDARAKYKSVVDVVDNVRAAGVDQLGLLTDQKRQAPVLATPPKTK